MGRDKYKNYNHKVQYVPSEVAQHDNHRTNSNSYNGGNRSRGNIILGVSDSKNAECQKRRSECFDEEGVTPSRDIGTQPAEMKEAEVKKVRTLHSCLNLLFVNAS
mmetsp:Transcript_65559/g.97070  ORF Transcript_65559/g.97070 Transcript_65559/m.97070 type:complete len:105 (-) Transcript_65559:663-977(-)